MARHWLVTSASCYALLARATSSTDPRSDSGCGYIYLLAQGAAAPRAVGRCGGREVLAADDDDLVVHDEAFVVHVGLELNVRGQVDSDRLHLLNPLLGVD
jgi:hypothetical protein